MQNQWILSWKMQYGVQNDSVFSQMMKVSDNFIAEQLLLLSYAYLTDTLNTSKMIAKAKSGLFSKSSGCISVGRRKLDCQGII